MPWAASLAEVEHARSTRRNRGGSARGGVVLGTLEEIIIETGKKTIKLGKSAFRGAHLAWLPSKRNFAVVFKKGNEQRPNVLPADIRRLHQTFHEAQPRAASKYEWPDKCPPLQRLGLIRSLTYAIPSSLRSPGKRGYNWVHAFGDHGESGHGPLVREKTYPDSLKPEAVMDRKGNLFIVRRPTNKYRVTKWIYW